MPGVLKSLKIRAQAHSPKEVLYLHRGALTLIFGPFGADVLVSHQWCDLFYRLLHSYRRHIEEVERAERDTLTVHRNEATVAWPEAIARRRQTGVIKAHPPPSHSTFPWTEISDFQEKRLKSMTASF
jgi:hypothetical protein